MVMESCALADSNDAPLPNAFMASSSARASLASAWAWAVATMPPPDLANSGSRITRRSFCRPWLTADCVYPQPPRRSGD